MAISNELSSDVAVALLENKSPQERKQLKDIILQVHSVLQKMSEETRADRFNRQLKNKAEPLTDQRSLAVSE
jgi:predicted transcriptional regulator